tara:strand:+ start:330 stop:1145 length:816 start_codon:yes stop_codon:yes gene_type:complete
MTSEIKVNTIKKNSGSTITIGENGDTVTITPGITAASLTSGSLPIARIDDDSITNAKLDNNSITINGSAVQLGGSVTVGETKPTISSISPTVITNDATNVTINGSNFVSVPIVEAINSTGAITAANSITFTSASQITANFTLATDGTYFIRVENNDGNAVRSGSALLTVSDVPAWTTAAGSLGTINAGGTINFTVAATSATSYSIVSGALPGGGSLNTSTGAITGTENAASQTTTYNFTIRATDAEAQTADRAFAITVSAGIQNSMRMDGS